VPHDVIYGFKHSAVMTFICKLLTVIANCAYALKLLRWTGDDS